jgi:hypothetical protein
MANNILLYNAALNGFVSSQLAGSQFDVSASPAAADFLTIVAQGVVFAALMDAAIPTDDAASPQPAGTGPISVVTTGVAIVPTTSAITEAQAVKTQLLQSLVFGYFFQRFQANFPAPSSTNFAASLTAPIAAIKAAYLAAAAGAIYT